MKKIKVCVLGMMFAMAVFALTACGNRDNATNNTTSAAGTQTTTQGVTTDIDDRGMNGTNGTNETNGTNNTNGTNESSTGVIGGIVDDVERGVNDVVDGTEKTTTHAADETSR